MIDGYKIGVQFDLLDKLSPALATMQASIGRMLEQTKALQMALNGVATAQGRVAASAGGMGAISTNLNNATRSAQAYAGAMRNAAAASHAIPANSGLSALGNRGAIQGVQARYTGSPPAPLVVPGLHDGMITAAVGAGILSLLKHPVEEGIKYQIAESKFKQFGMTPGALTNINNWVASNKVAGTSQSEMLMNIVEVQGIFRDSSKKTIAQQLESAKNAAPVMAQIQYATAGLDEHGKKLTHAQKLDMIRAAEMRPGAINDHHRFNEVMNNQFKAYQSSGGNIDYSQIRQAQSRGGTALKSVTDRVLYGVYEPFIGEMKGGQFGDAIMTATNRMMGITNPKKELAQFMALGKHESAEIDKFKADVKFDNKHDTDRAKWMGKLGLWDANMIDWNNKGGVEHFRGNPMSAADSKLFTGNFVEYYRQRVLPAYAANGITSQDDITRQNAVLFGRQGSKLANLVDTQMAVSDKSALAYDKALGIKEAGANVDKTMIGGKLRYTAALADFNLALGKSGGLLDLASKGLNKLTASLEWMTKFANENKNLTKFAMYALAAFGALAVLGGGLLMVGMAFKSLGTVLKFALSLIGRIGIIGPLLAGLGKAIFTFGRFLVMTPIGMVLTAIAMAAYLLYTNWSTLLPKIKAVWAIIKADFMFTINAIKTSIKTNLTAIKTNVNTIWSSIKKTFNDSLKSVSDIMTSIKDTIVGKLQEAIAAISGMFSGIGGMVSGFGSRISNMFSMAKTASKQDVVRTGHEGGGIVIKNSFDMHGIATEVSKRQAKAMGGPRRGASGHDGSMGLKMISQGAY